MEKEEQGTALLNNHAQGQCENHQVAQRERLVTARKGKEEEDHSKKKAGRKLKAKKHQDERKQASAHQKIKSGDAS